MAAFASSSRLMSFASDAQPFVQRALALLEARFRTLALRGLADWERLDRPAPELFRVVAALQRPAWGHWNGLLSGLRDARKHALRTATVTEREKIKKATTLEAILEFLDRETGPEHTTLLRALADVTRTTLPRKSRMATLLTMPITLRNLVTHFAPVDPAWWERAAHALQLLQDAEALRPPLPTMDRLPEPWFWSPPDSGDVYTFNGLREDAVIYAAPNGEPRDVPAMLRSVLLAFQRLLGKTEQQEGSLKRLLSKTAPEELKGVLLGDYLVGRPVGSGGNATVHAGTQLSTGRKVAIKILRDGMTEDTRARFHQEAVFLSRLNHPNVVSILGYGEETWSPPRATDLARSLSKEPWFQEFSRQAPVKSFIVMEWIDGPTLEDVYQRRHQPEPDAWQLATWFLQAAQALGAVHSAGLIHRDVKPSNLMVTEQGVVTLMDFGVARTQDEIRTVVTTPDHPVGTPAYMSPEQLGARDVDAEVGPASDIYSLCATFYELYTQARVFAHDKETAVSLQTRKQPGARPVEPRRLVPQLPWELETILLGGLERGLAERYRSMADLERDLRHYLHDEPIEYKRPSRWRRLRLWYRRNTLVANLGTLAASMLLLTAAVALVAALITGQALGEKTDALEGKTQQFNRAEIEKTRAERNLIEKTQALTEKTEQFNRAETATQAANTRAEELADRLYISNVSYAFREFFANNLRRTEQVLDDCDPLRRGWEWYYIKHLCHAEQRRLPNNAWGLNCLALSKSGKMVAAGDTQGDVAQWIQLKDQYLRIPMGPTFRREGLSGFKDAVEVRAIALSPDGKWLAAASAPGSSFNSQRRQVKVWDARDTEIASWPDEAACLAVSPDSRLLALGLNKIVRIMDMTTRQETFRLEASKSLVLSVVFSEDGKQLATGGMDGWLRVWDVATHKEVFAVATPDIVRCLAFHGRAQFVACGNQTRIDIYDTNTKRKHDDEEIRPWLTLRGHTGVVGALAFHPTGVWLASGGGDSTVKVWNLASGDDFQTFRGHYDIITGVLFSSDGKELVSCSKDGHVKFWNPAEYQEARSRNGTFAAISPDGKYVGTTGLARRHPMAEGARSVWIWDPQSGAPVREFKEHQGDIACVAFSADSKLAASGGVDLFTGEIKVWSVATGHTVQTLHDESRGGVYRVAFRPDDRVLASASKGWGFGEFRTPGDVKLWDLRTGTVVLGIAQLDEDLTSLAFSPDGKLLVLAGIGCGVRIVDGRTGQEILRLAEAGFSAAFSPDGKLLLTTGGNPYSAGWVKVWKVDGWQLLYHLTGHSNRVMAAAMSPDGKRLVSGGADGMLRIWDVASKAEILALKHPNVVNNVILDRHGQFLVSSSGDSLNPGYTKIWVAAPQDMPGEKRNVAGTAGDAGDRKR
jgi:eukaryotic-like serine/threonine-protein kinase